MTRLDVELVRRRLVPTRSAARRAVIAGWVTVDGAVAQRPSVTVRDEAALVVDDDAVRYVGRAGHKLAAALDAFAIDPAQKQCLDVGSSTGGFTDVLVQRDAAHVVAVDVGTDQLHPSLREHQRVRSLEGTDIRSIGASKLGGPFDIVTVDVSFISLRHLVPTIVEALHAQGDAVILAKPQFEVGRSALRKDGVVADPDVASAAVADVVVAFDTGGLRLADSVASPIAGSAGNQETLLHLRHKGAPS